MTTSVRTERVALVGSPNAGKTSLFNALTGIRARTANYPGVTVARREAHIELDGRPFELIDLPGTYGLDPISPDEAVVVDTLRGDAAGVGAPDAMLIVADATTLRRSLFLVASLLDLDLPTCLVVTMVDEVAARGGSVDIDRLSAALGVPVAAVVGHRGVGLDAVRRLIVDAERWERPIVPPPPVGIERTRWVDSVAEAAVTTMEPDRRTATIDNIVLNPVAGVVIFVIVMLAFFQSIFTLANPMVDALDRLVSFLADTTRHAVGGTLGDLLGGGVISGVGGVLVFLPTITILLIIIAVMERTGYLARAALLADRVMGRFGLEGRSFVSLLSSFACAVPGIMSARTIPNEHRRLATMMASPLMTCSARLPVFTLLIASFVPDRAVLGPLRAQGLTLFGLYLLGATSGLIYSAVLSRFALSGPEAPFMMELPPYRWPTVRGIALHVWDGVWAFLRKAGTIIFATSLVLWLMLNFPHSTPPGGLSAAEEQSYQMEHSIGGRIGAAMEPVFGPLGFEWRTDVAILGSLAAREVFVSTLAITTASESDDNLPDRLGALRREDGTAVYDGATVAALLVFFVYALQCFSTVAVLRRETNSWKWPAVAVSSMFVMAYLGALIARVIVQGVAS